MTDHDRMSCPVLKRAHAQSPEKLIGTAFKVLPERTLQAVFGTLHPNQRRILKQQHRRQIPLHRLADTLYYHLGTQLSRRGRWNEMTILQMQHELEKRGKLDEGEAATLSEWKLRLRLACVIRAEEEEWKNGAHARREKQIEARRAWAANLAAYDEIDNEQSQEDLVEEQGPAIS